MAATFGVGEFGGGTFGALVGASGTFGDGTFGSTSGTFGALLGDVDPPGVVASAALLGASAVTVAAVTVRQGRMSLDAVAALVATAKPGNIHRPNDGIIRRPRWHAVRLAHVSSAARGDIHVG
jgi:hypothetical protein